MSLIWAVNDKVVVSPAHLATFKYSLESTQTNLMTLQVLGNLLGVTLKILEIGSVEAGSAIYFYIKLLPLLPTGLADTGHSSFNEGKGSVAYFTTEGHLNSAFKPAAGAFPHSISIQAINGFNQPLPRAA